MKTLAISADLKLPIDAATQTFAFIARKGAGKTYAAGKLTELLLEADVQVIVLDTVGNWYGLRLSADGKSKGFDVPVFGGLRGDLPLQAQAGELVADVAVDTGRSLILDLSQFSLSDRKRFATAFGERLWKKKKAESHPTPVMLVIEESQLIIPQFTRAGDDARMVGIYEEIIRLGRNYGIGCTMISQRPQSVNKEVLNQTECLFVLQVNGSQERKALKDWITHQGMDPALLDELPSLPIGTAYVWSPQWLGILKKVKIAKKETFDASATPKVGDRTVRRDPAPLDLGELEKQMAATIETAKLNDPRELKRQIVDLKRTNADLQRTNADLQRTGAKTRAPKVEIKKIPILTESHVKRLEAAAKKIIDAAANGDKLAKELLAVIRNANMQENSHNRITPSPAPCPAPVVRSAILPPRRDVIAGDSTVSGPQQKILNTLAVFETLGVAAPEKSQLAVFSGASPTSSSYSNNLGALRSAGLIDYPQPARVGLTEAGRAIAVNEVAFTTLRELHAEWVGRVGAAKGKILDALTGIYPDDISKDQLAAAIGASITSSSYSNNLGALRTLGLIDYPKPGRVVATDVLFPPLPLG